MDNEVMIMTVQNSHASYRATAADSMVNVQLRLQKMTMSDSASQVQQLLQAIPATGSLEPGKGQYIDVRV